MSYAAEKWARAQKTGKASAKAVLIELAWRSNPKDGKCCPSVDTLADCLEMDRKTVMSATSHLEKIGLICKRVAWVNRRKMVFYTFPTFDASEWAEGKEASTEIGTTEIGTTVSGTTENGTYVGTESGTTGGTEIGTGTRKKNSKGEQENSSMSPLAPASDDLVLSPDTDIRPWAEVDPDVRPCSAVDPEVRPWSESPAPKHTQKNFRTKTTVARPDDVGEQVWDEFLILRKEKRKTFTELALRGMRREAEAAGITLEQAMTLCVEQGWQSFQAKYVRDKGGNGYRSKRQPTCPGDWENEYKGVDYTRGAVMKEFTPEESAELERYCEEMGF